MHKFKSFNFKCIGLSLSSIYRKKIGRLNKPVDENANVLQKNVNRSVVRDNL